MQERRREILNRITAFVDTYTEENGRVPSNLEIAEAVGQTPSGISRNLQYMRENNMIRLPQKKARARKPSEKPEEGLIWVPILGEVACGLPNLADGNVEDYVQLPTALFGHGDFYLLRANGDSMIEIGIDDGDLVLVRQQNTAKPGQVVVALLEDGEAATLKRYFPEPQKKRVRLHPENREMNDIYARGCLIQGVAVQVLKEIR